MKLSVPSTLLLLGCVMYVTAYPEPEPINQDNNNVQSLIRSRRFVDGNQNLPNQKKPEWEVKPDLNRDRNGNVNGQVLVEKHGKDHDLEAGWGQTIRGPNKHSETWHVGGSIRWP